MSHSLGDLFENVFCVVFGKALVLSNEAIKIATSCIFHNHHDVLLVFENLIKFDDVGMPYLLENIHLLENFFA